MQVIRNSPWAKNNLSSRMRVNPSELVFSGAHCWSSLSLVISGWVDQGNWQETGLSRSGPPRSRSPGTGLNSSVTTSRWFLRFGPPGSCRQVQNPKFNQGCCIKCHADSSTTRKQPTCVLSWTVRVPPLWLRLEPPLDDSPSVVASSSMDGNQAGPEETHPRRLEGTLFGARCFLFERNQCLTEGRHLLRCSTVLLKRHLCAVPWTTGMQQVSATRSLTHCEAGEWQPAGVKLQCGDWWTQVGTPCSQKSCLPVLTSRTIDHSKPCRRAARVPTCNVHIRLTRRE